MAEEVVGLQGSFSVDTSSLDNSATRVQAASNNIINSLQNVKNATNELKAATDRQREAQMASFIPLQKLQVEGLKFQDTLKQQETFLGRNASKLMVLSQVADDAQYGFRAIVNQIPMAVAAFGGSMGLAGAIGGAGVAINILVTHWDKLRTAMHGTVIQTQAEQMERLAEATKAASKETENLERNQRTTSGIKQQMATAGETPEEKAGKAAVGKLLEGGNYDEILKSIMRTNATRTQVPKVTDADVTARIMQTMGAAGKGDRDVVRKELEKEAAKQFKDMLKLDAQKILSDAQFGQGKEADDARTIIAEALQESGGPLQGLGQQFRGTTRAGIQADEMRALEVEQEKNVAAYDKKLSETFNEAHWDQEEEALKKQSEKAEKDRERLNVRNEFDRNIMAETLDAFKDMEKKEEGFEEKDASLNERLRGLMVGDRRFNTSQSMGLESYEGSIKATTAEQQLKKQEEANKILAEIRKNTAERKINARRVAR